MGERAPFEEFEHPADIGLRARGRTLAELLENAARGMIQFMVAPETVEPRHSRHLRVEGEDAESLLVSWLSEILFAFDADRFAPANVRVEHADAAGGMAQGVLDGEPIDPARHELRYGIKAVTWHNLKVERTGEGLEVSIIFDV